MAVVVKKEAKVRFHKQPGLRSQRVEYLTKDQDLIRDLEHARKDFTFHAQRFMPGMFDLNFDSQKTEIAKMYADATIPFMAILGEVGCGKTSLFHAYIHHAICWRQCPFLLWVCGLGELASDETEILKTNLQSQMVTDIFGRLLVSQVKDGTRVSVAKKGWGLRDPFTNEVFMNVVAKGTQQGLLGIGRLASGRRWRVTHAFLDDPESIAKLLATQNSREKTREWFNETLLGRVDQHYEPPIFGPYAGKWQRDPDDPYWFAPWRVIVASNYRHPDAMIHYLLEDERFKSLKLARAEKDKDGVWHSCVPELYSDEEVRVQISRAESQPQRKAAFYRDHLLITDGGDPGQYWGGVTFQYYPEEDEKSIIGDHRVYKAIIRDSTRSDKPKGDPAAILPIAIDPEHAKIYYLDYHQTRDVEEKAPKAYAYKWLELAIEYDIWNFALELVQSDAWLKTIMEGVFDAEGYGGKYRWVDLDVTTAGTGITEGQFGSIKARRAYAGAQLFHPTKPTHMNGHVWLSKRIENSPLIGAFKAAPSNKVSCGTDCAGYVPQVMRAENIHWEDQTVIEEDVLVKKRQDRERLRRYLSRRLAGAAC